MKETELFIPLKTFFEAMGYHIQAEVMHLDFLACKEESCLGIELKLSLSTQVIAQAIKRLLLVETVYIATLKPAKQTKTFKDKLTIIKALGIGLIYIDTTHQQCQVLFDPQKKPSINQKKYVKLKKEFDMRMLQKNQAGMTKQKIMTHYKESLLVLLGILIDGQKSIAYIQTHYHIEAVQKKLYNNYEGWFKSVSRGIYTLTDQGIKAYQLYKDDMMTLLDHYKKR
jgi:hypothetical protein